MGHAAYSRASAVIRERIETPKHVNSLPGSVTHPEAEQASPAAPKPFAVGETVYCTVRALRGMPMEVTAVKRDRIKVTCSNAWCPASNFQREPS